MIVTGTQPPSQGSWLGSSGKTPFPKVGDPYICAICGREKTIGDEEGLEKAGKICEGLGASFGPVNLCPSCQKRLEEPRSKVNIDGKRVPLPPISPEALKQELSRKKLYRPRSQFPCPVGYMDTDPSKLPYPKAYGKVMRWKFGPKGILARGNTGAGKSRSIWCLLGALHEQGLTIEAIGSGPFVNRAAEKFRDGTGPYWLRKMIMADIWFLDDFGNEPSAERGEAEIYDVIKQRIEAARPVFVATQYTGQKIYEKSRLKDRALAIIRLLGAECELIKFGDND